MADDQSMDQAEIERLLGAGKQETTSAAPEQPTADNPAQSLDQSEIESLLTGGAAAAGGSEPPQADQAGPAPTTPSVQPAPDPQAGQAAAQDSSPLAQESIDNLLQQAGKALATPSGQPAPSQQTTPDPTTGDEGMLPGDVDYLLKQAEQALESINARDSQDLPQNASAFHLEEFSGAAASSENATLDLIRDVELDLKIELGRTHMYLEDVLKLRKGSVVPLDKLAGDPVDIYVNGRLIARGEVLVLSDNFCVRVAELIAGTSTSA